MNELRINNLHIIDYQHRLAIYFIVEKLILNNLYSHIKNKIFNIFELKILTRELNEKLC